MDCAVGASADTAGAVTGDDGRRRSESFMPPKTATINAAAAASHCHRAALRVAPLARSDRSIRVHTWRGGEMGGSCLTAVRTRRRLSTTSLQLLHPDRCTSTTLC